MYFDYDLDDLISDVLNTIMHALNLNTHDVP